MADANRPDRHRFRTPVTNRYDAIFVALLFVIRKIHRQDSFRTKQNTQQTFTHINLYSPQSKQCEKVARARVHANVMRSTGIFDSKWCANVNICARTQHGAHISWQLHIQMMS